MECKSNVKVYPFNASRHAHDIEFRRNRCFNEIVRHECGKSVLSLGQYDVLIALLDRLDDLRAVMCGQPIVFLDGTRYALAQECIGWAASQRGSR